MARSVPLVVVGVIAYFALYVSQAVVLALFLVQNFNRVYWCFVVLYVPSLAYFFIFFCTVNVAKDDETVRHVVVIWSLYIVLAFVPIVATIFACVVGNLSSSDGLGPNILRSMLCFAPGLLILLLTVTVSPKHVDFILALSVTTALDLFDGIEMLEIILLQGHDFKLNHATEVSIIVFACLGFLVSPASLLQHKITDDNSGSVKHRKRTAVVKAIVQRFLINLPFLVIRSYVWGKHGYESTVFIAKNIIALIVGSLEIIIAIGCVKCGREEES